MACAEIAGDPPEVMEHGSGGPETWPSPSDADVEAVAQDEIGPPERDPHDAHRDQRHDGFAQTPTAKNEEEPLRGDDEHRIRMAGQHQAQLPPPTHEPA